MTKWFRKVAIYVLTPKFQSETIICKYAHMHVWSNIYTTIYYSIIRNSKRPEIIEMSMLKSMIVHLPDGKLLTSICMICKDLQDTLKKPSISYSTIWVKKGNIRILTSVYFEMWQGTLEGCTINWIIMASVLWGVGSG